MNLKKLLFGGTECKDAVGDFGLLLARLFTGITLAFAHGQMKLPPGEGFVRGVGGIGFPAPEIFAWAAGLAEFAGGLLLALGLATRPASLFIAVTMAVAAFGRHAADPLAKKEPALLFLALAVIFLFCGSGRLGIDAMIRGKDRRY